MDDPKHIHPPLCCCQHDPRDLAEGDLYGDRIHALIVCPLCPEHGELASL